jgi:hypothetical protein
MPKKKDPRNEVGVIGYAVVDKVLSDHTAKNIFGNVNYAKHFFQGTVVGFFDGCGRSNLRCPPMAPRSN